MKKILFLLFFIFTREVYSLELNSKQAVLLDPETNEILFNKNADEKSSPSSMTKIMTSYLIFEALENGKITLTDNFFISTNAWKQIGSRTFLMVNTKVSVEDLIKGLVVQSGNDAAIALAEGMSGSTEAFTDLMNLKATELKLTNTNFTNPIGFSDDNHYMSVKDIAILSKNLIKNFPQYYIEYFSMPEFKYNNINQPNRNILLKTYDGADGIKTGHTQMGGYGLASSAVRNNRRLIAVVNGASSEAERAEESRKLLDYGFLTLSREELYKANETITSVKVKYGKSKTVNIVAKENVLITAKSKNNIITELVLDEMLKAPLDKNQKVGTLIVKSDISQKSYSLYPENNVKSVGFIKKFFLSILYFLRIL